MCVCVCFLNTVLTFAKTKIDTSFQHTKNPGQAHNMWLRWMPGKLESELTPNGPLALGAHGPKNMGMRKHFPKHAPPKKKQ